MRYSLPLIFIAVLGIVHVPFIAHADALESCVEGTIECICVTTSESSTSFTEDIETEGDCNAACEEAVNDDPNITGWSIQCENEEGEVVGVAAANLGDSSSADAAEPTEPLDAPYLSIPIPGLELSSAEQSEDGTQIQSNWIAEYIAAVYIWMIAAGALLVVVIMMIGGMQYILARGDSGKLGRAKDRIKHAITGLVLLLSAYMIADLVDPSLVTFNSLTLSYISQQLHEETSGFEGSASGGIAADCQEASDNAQADTSGCGMDQSFGKVTDAGWSCNYHIEDKGYDYTQVSSLDYPVGWGSPIYAPFDGTISLTEGTEANTGNSYCGNSVYLSGSGATINICHMKDFIGEDGNAVSGSVSKGDLIGHVGGNCCAGETTPSDYSMAAYCSYDGPTCSSPYADEDCGCQPWEQAGNTSGAHVHVSMWSGGYILSCLENPDGT